MSASKKAKAAGLDSLKEMSELVGVPVTTLNDWVKKKPKTFEALAIGAAELKQRNEQ